MKNFMRNEKETTQNNKRFFDKKTGHIDCHYLPKGILMNSDKECM